MAAAACALFAIGTPTEAVAADAPAPTESARPSSGERRLPERRDKEPVEHVRIGPLVGLGFPRPFAIEGFVKIERLIGVGLEYSFLPPMNVMNVDATFDAIAADLRVFPFRGAFFIGARVGRQWLDAKTTMTAGPLGTITESMAASTWFLNPRAGFLHTFRSGITVGVDAGVQIPVSPSYDRSGPASEAGLANDTDVDRALVAVSNALGNKPTPTIDLLRLGFLF